jgi:hypothetical protein
MMRAATAGATRRQTAEARDTGYRFPPEVIHQAIWLSPVLSSRGVEDCSRRAGSRSNMRLVRRWVNHFGPMIAAHLRKRRPTPHATWHLEEVHLKIDGGWFICGAPSTPRALRTARHRGLSRTNCTEHIIWERRHGRKSHRFQHYQSHCSLAAARGCPR